MEHKIYNAMNEIDDGLIEEAALAGSAERKGLRIARNIGLSVCGAAAAAAAITFGVTHHLSSLPQKVDLLPAQSNEANSDISDVIAGNTLKTLEVPRVDAADVDAARLSETEPYFIEAGNQWKIFDDDGNMLTDSDTILIMDCGGYWVEYDVTSDEGELYEVLDIREALKKAEYTLEASLLPGRQGVDMGYHALSENWCSFTVTARFDDGSCLGYSLQCDTNHEQWTMTLLSEEEGYLNELNNGANFFHEERGGVYDSARFNDGYGAYLCDNNGELRVVKHTAEGYFGYLPFGGKEYIYTLENTETGSRQKYCVKENGDAISVSEDFLTIKGTAEHQDDPQNIKIPTSLCIDDGMGSGKKSEIGSSKMYHLLDAPDYTGLAPSFLVDKDGKFFLYDFTWLYPCKLEKLDEPDEYIITISYFPEGREEPEDGYLHAATVRAAIKEKTITFESKIPLYIDEGGEVKEIYLYEGTIFSVPGASFEALTELANDLDETEWLREYTANLKMEKMVRASQEENADRTPYTGEFILPVDKEFGNITAYFGYDVWRGGTHYGIDISYTGIAGADIYAAQSGTVILTGSDEYYGKYAVIDHGDGLSTQYSHCAELTVTEGQSVSQGDIIGYVGSTGFATGEHLGFAVRMNGVAVDPLEYITVDIPQVNVITNEEVQQTLNDHWAELIASVPDPEFVYPAGGDYAIIEHVFGHSPESGYYKHKGIDIGVERGEPVLAAADGEVILAEWYESYGKCVMIQHDNGVVTLYGHCDELYVTEGDTVSRGQAIAAAGATGQAASAHLHFEVRIDDETVDPALFQYRILMNGELSEATYFD